MQAFNLFFDFQLRKGAWACDYRNKLGSYFLSCRTCSFEHTIECTEFREKPLPHWLVCFADTASGPIQHLFFAVVLSDGKIVQPKVSERL